jgi:CheY-like chemotaxis protein
MTGQPRIILIEDEPVLARQVEESLSVAGFVVIAAPNGERGLRAVAAEGIGLSAVVAEADLPDIRGTEIRQVLAEFHPELPVLVMSRSSASSAVAEPAPAIVPPVNSLDGELIVRRLLELLSRADALRLQAASATRTAADLIARSRQLRSVREAVAAETHAISRGTPPACPKCRSDRVAPILYGSDRLNHRDDFAAGRVVLGGAVRGPEGPDRYCRDCEHRWSSSPGSPASAPPS